MNAPLLQSTVSGLKLLARGKVRDVYEIDAQHLLFVASDRISAFDRVMATPIPDKGKILTALSLFWFDLLRDICPNHVVTSDVGAMPAEVRRERDQLAGRSLMVKRLKILPVEAIVRGYVAGSGWKEYKKSGTICGIPLPAGLTESAELPQPIYSPSTKAEIGSHDENISPARAAEILGKYAAAVDRYSIELYGRARDHGRTRGVIIADTKFEFGIDATGTVVLADEVLTPDSSRFWPADRYAAGRAQDSFDKQYLRDWLESVKFDKDGPGIDLPPEVVAKTRAKYLEAYRALTGVDFRA
ncbi:MAG: phosphoribosylaminoimidazolesuccinocarboxamide synthase [Planctomycetota bacterium]